MVTRNVKIQVGTDFDIDNVAMLVQLANQYKSNLFLEDDKHKFNAKSIMGMTTLGMGKCNEFTVIAEGEDEEAAAARIEEFFKSL